LTRERRHWSAQEKVKLLRRHLIEKVPVSKICEEARLSPSQYHRWQELLFANAALALGEKRVAERSQDQRVEKLEQKIKQKNSCNKPCPTIRAHTGTRRGSSARCPRTAVFREPYLDVQIRLIILSPELSGANA